jgi:hypothetical protein
MYTGMIDQEKCQEDEQDRMNESNFGNLAVLEPQNWIELDISGVRRGGGCCYRIVGEHGLNRK